MPVPVEVEYEVSREKLLSDYADRDDGGWATFEFPVDFDQLVDIAGIGELNNLLDEFVEDGHLLSDIRYMPLRVDGDMVIVEVTADLGEYLEKEGE